LKFVQLFRSETYDGEPFVVETTWWRWGLHF